MPALLLPMDPHEKSEILIAAIIFGVFIAYILARHACSTIPGSCTASWVVFGIIFISAAIFLMLKIFRA